MEKEMKEIWKLVRGFEEYAEVSNYGQIHRFERVWYSGKNHKIKKVQEETFTYGSETTKGYLNATIGGISKGVHVWVYLTFVGEIPDGLEVNHIDEDKHNNRLDNLNLMTPKENSNWGTRNAKISAAQRGQKLSNETKKKIGDALRGRKRPAEFGAKVSAALKGRKQSPEHIAKKAAALTNHPKRSKTVQALDKITGEVVMEFPSIMEAQRQGFSRSHISACCRNCYSTHKGNIYKGLIWRYAEK